MTELYDRSPELVDHVIICKAAGGDVVARRAIDRSAEPVARGAVLIASVLDIGLLVIGGKSIVHVEDIHREKAVEYLRTRPLARALHTVEVAISEVRPDGAVHGTASLVLHDAYAPDMGTSPGHSR